MSNKQYIKYLELVASFLIGLIITIPFYVADANATIEKLSAKGTDGLAGYIRQNDFLDISATVNIQGDTITSDQVVLGSASQFDSCAATVGGSFECKARFPGAGTEFFEASSVVFTVNSFTDSKSQDDLKSGDVTVDNKAPVVQISGPQGTVSSSSQIELNVVATDYACDAPSCENKCVGLKSFQVYTEDGTFDLKEDVASTECVFSKTISVDPKSLDNGRVAFFAKATDKFGQVSSPSSIILNVINQGPQISTDSFSIARKGVSIRSFSDFPVDVVVSVNITSANLNADSVFADLSTLNPTASLNKVKGACSSDGDVYHCTWAINLQPSNAGSKTITINASDTFGNEETATITKNLVYDNQGPVVDSINAGTLIDGKLIAKATGNNVVITFIEPSGMSADETFLHVDSAKVPASSCTDAINPVCSWNDLNFNAGTKKLSIKSDTLDIVGNTNFNEKSLSVEVDSIPPQLVLINITPIGGSSQAFDKYIKTGDKLAIIAVVKEDKGLRATADLSGVISGASDVPGSCEPSNGNEWLCTWITDPINTNGPSPILINFSDTAGNTITATKSIRIFGTDTTSVPDYWDNTVTCSPSAIDRSIGTLINQRMYCLINLQPKSSQAVSTVFISPATCSGDTSILQSTDTLRTEAGSVSPLIRLTLKKSDFNVNSAKLSCTMNVFSKVGNKITQNPEAETATINVQFSNQPLGEISSEVNDKIKQAKEDAEGIWKLIGVLNKIMQWAQKICNLLLSLWNGIVVLFTVFATLTGTEATVGNIPVIGQFLKPSLTAASVSTCTTGEVAQKTSEGLYNNIGTKFCAYVNCKLLPFAGGPVKKFIDEMPGSNYVGGFSNYMDPNKNLIVATLFLCLPGIVYGLDKYRQIKCLYADCLQNAVGQDGMPISVCEDQKAYATCKYITGEIFAIVPYTAVFDHFMNLIKNALSNPFGIVGIAFGVFCFSQCSLPAEFRLAAMTTCKYAKMMSQLGEVIKDVKNIIDEGFKIREDYCDRLDNEKDSKK